MAGSLECAGSRNRGVAVRDVGAELPEPADRHGRAVCRGRHFDVMGRIIAVRMSEILGQQVVVENTTGAGGIIACSA